MTIGNFFGTEPKVFFNRIRNVKMPERGTDYAAGIDFFVPEIDDDFIEEFEKMNHPTEKGPFACSSAVVSTFNDEKCIEIPRGARVLIPSGIRSLIYPKASALVQENKTGMSCKRGTQVTAQVVDSDYTGEIYVGFVNLWEHNQTIILKEGDKMGQYLHLPVYLSKPDEISDELFFRSHEGSKRGTGAFGSTDVKQN